METCQSFTTQQNSQACERFKAFESTMLGKPYVARACGYEAVDCWGLVVLFYAECMGIRVNNCFSYERGMPFAVCYDDEVIYWRETQNPQRGDLIVSYIGSAPVHVGIWWGYDKILHAREKTFVRIDRIRTLTRLSTKIRYFKYAAD